MSHPRFESHVDAPKIGGVMIFEKFDFGNFCKPEIERYGHRKRFEMMGKLISTIRQNFVTTASKLVVLRFFENFKFENFCKPEIERYGHRTGFEMMGKLFSIIMQKFLTIRCTVAEL
jgi:hypothetical protein